MAAKTLPTPVLSQELQFPGAPIPYSQLNAPCRFPYMTWAFPRNTYARPETLTVRPSSPKIITRPPLPPATPFHGYTPHPPKNFPLGKPFYRSNSNFTSGMIPTSHDHSRTHLPLSVHPPVHRSQHGVPPSPHSPVAVHEMAQGMGCSCPKNEGKSKSLNTPMTKSSPKRFARWVSEDWSPEYRKSINCNRPKGFSQRAHCQGRKKR